ncbi:hypothetical protein P9112_008913 [Eukaryota sp. TZLM1-RC]
MSPNFHPIFYIDKIDGTENERYYIEDLNNFERIVVIRERCSNDLPIFEPCLCRIRSEQKLAIASKDPSFNNFGHLILRASGSSAKIHGDYLGPFLITEIVFYSSVNIKNLCTGPAIQASLKHLAPWHSSLPANDECHSWVAAGDVEEHIIEKVLSQDGDFWHVQWPGKEITIEHVSTVQNTAAYKDFIKTSKARNRN